MISIHRPTPQQANDLSNIAFVAKAHWGYPQHWMEMWKPQLTFTSGYFRENESWVALADQVPVGFYTLLEKGANAWVENLWVLPDHMGKGIGKALFHHAIDQASRRGYKTLQLEADPHAAGFYEKMGMYKISERQYEIDGQPRILPIMEMKL
jgi:GNAT superfamily N-acetyltransferase